MTIEIPIKFPSLNEYINETRRNKFAGATFKRKYQRLIIPYLADLPKPIPYPVVVLFHWVEENHRRDLDNIAFGKKFVLDALVQNGNLENDNYKFVRGFADAFSFEDEAKLIITLMEYKDENSICQQR